MTLEWDWQPRENSWGEGRRGGEERRDGQPSFRTFERNEARERGEEGRQVTEDVVTRQA